MGERINIVYSETLDTSCRPIRLLQPAAEITVVRQEAVNKLVLHHAR